MNGTELLAYAKGIATGNNRIVDIAEMGLDGVEPLTHRRLVLVDVSSRGVSVNTVAELLFLGFSYGKPTRFVFAKRENNAIKLLATAVSELTTTDDAADLAIVHYGLTYLAANGRKRSYPLFWHGIELLHATVAAAILRGDDPREAADIELSRYFGRREVSRATYQPKQALQAQVRQFLGSGYLEKKQVQFTLHPGLQQQLNLLENGKRAERINEMNDILCRRYGCC